MGLFKSRNAKWAAIVMPSAKETEVSKETLEAATDIYIQEHTRILKESIKFFLTSKNKETRKSRYKLASSHYGSLCSVFRYANKTQRKELDQTLDEFIKAEDFYLHPNKAKAEALREQKKQESDEFWETYAFMEMVDIFLDDWK